MDAIQAVSKTNPQTAAAAAANDDTSVAGIFSTLLDAIGAKFKPDQGTLGMDTKLMRGNADADAREARDAAKVREDKNDNRAAKSKEAKARDNDDTETEETDAASNEDSESTDQAAAEAPTEQAAAPVAVVVPVDVPLITTEVLAPVLVAQQVSEAAVVQQTAAATTAVVTEAAAITTEAAAATVDTGAKVVEQAATVEAPAAVQKATEVVGQNFKQAVAKAAGPAEAAVTQDTAATTTVATDAGAAKGKDAAQTVATTQRSTEAQAQSQDLSQKVGPETKAQVKVSVTNHAGPQTAVVNSVYDIYAGYSNTQTSTANGQVGVADASNALVQNTKTPAEPAQAQVAIPSPVIAPQSPSAQQGPSAAPTASAMRADISAPAPTQAGGSHTSFGESSFGNAGTSNQSNATSQTSQTAPAERPLPPAQQVIDQIKVVINRAAKAGLDKVTIQLKPHELGRVDVQLEMSEDHKVRVTVTADNKDTLALLQNDSRTLERALNDAGLRTDANNLHFSLRSEAEARDAENGRGGSRNGRADNNGASDEAEDIAMTYDYAEIARARRRGHVRLIGTPESNRHVRSCRRRPG